MIWFKKEDGSYFRFNMDLIPGERRRLSKERRRRLIEDWGHIPTGELRDQDGSRYLFEVDRRGAKTVVYLHKVG